MSYAARCRAGLGARNLPRWGVSFDQMVDADAVAPRFERVTETFDDYEEATRFMAEAWGNRAAGIWRNMSGVPFRVRS